MDSFEIDALVIGAGVVGLATARALALAGHETLILEKNAAFGEETSARNSEVIHAGIVYADDSRKARLCLRGKILLYEYCAARGIPHARLGKLIVATDPGEEAALDRTLALAEAAGVTDLERLSRTQIRALEPDLRGVEALYSPSTGIIDSHAYMLALLGEAEAHGAQLVLNSAVRGGAVLPDGRIEIVAGSDTPMRLIARHVVNTGGLWAQDVARAIEGFPAATIPPRVLAKGSYFSLQGRGPFSRLVYPAPPGDGSLGVHLTLDLAGRTKFGPDIEMLGEVSPTEIDYTVDPARGAAFYAAVRRYWPGLPDHALVPDYAGCRPKLAGGDSGAVDFRIDGSEVHGLPGHVMTYGLESPALTASLAIAEDITAKALNGA